MKRILYSAVTFCLAACAGQKALNPEKINYGAYSDKLSHLQKHAGTHSDHD